MLRGPSAHVGWKRGRQLLISHPNTLLPFRHRQARSRFTCLCVLSGVTQSMPIDSSSSSSSSPSHLFAQVKPNMQYKTVNVIEQLEQDSKAQQEALTAGVKYTIPYFTLLCSVSSLTQQTRPTNLTHHRRGMLRSFLVTYRRSSQHCSTRLSVTAFFHPHRNVL